MSIKYQLVLCHEIQPYHNTKQVTDQSRWPFCLCALCREHEACVRARRCLQTSGIQDFEAAFCPFVRFFAGFSAGFPNDSNPFPFASATVPDALRTFPNLLALDSLLGP